MQVELHLLGTSSRWRLDTAKVRIGRDPGCEVVLPPERFPMVSRKHATLTIENDQIHLTDNQSVNGIFVNGMRTAGSMLTKMDRFRLGKDGPEFEIQIIGEQPAAAARTVVSAESASGMPTRVDLSDTGGAPTRIAKPPESALRAAGKTEDRESGKANRTSPVSVRERQTASGFSAEEEHMIEQKLNSLRNLVYLLVAMVAILLGVIFYQSQQIDKNRAELNDMRRQAQSAVAQFTPALDQRLSTLDQRLGTFDQRLNQVDGKMKDTEEEFMTRLNTELPKMLDKYVDRKMKQLGQSMPQVTQPEQK
jgi:pSer/pThr/pTyr-binding forkhead associated (FHA) protein